MKPHYVTDESRFLTKKLGVTYADDEDNTRKAAPVDKYKKMAQRRPQIFRKKWARWFMRREWGRKLMFLLFGRKKDKKNGWPSWVSKTDEERIENCVWTLRNKDPWIVTEKIDGTSTTFTMKRGKHKKKEFYVCSRNVCFDSVDKPCYYDTNVYWEMAQKYNMYEVLSKMLDVHPNAEWITIQGETYGAGVQRNEYGLSTHEFAAFNVITSNEGRWNSCHMKDVLELEYQIPCVPILNEAYILPDTVEELREYVNSQPSTVNGEMKEGIVCRSPDGIQSFKCVSPEYLLKYHG
jgi:RNA ligase (TIGR02306 family)